MRNIKKFFLLVLFSLTLFLIRPASSLITVPTTLIASFLQKNNPEVNIRVLLADELIGQKPHCFKIEVENARILREDCKDIFRFKKKVTFTGLITEDLISIRERSSRKNIVGKKLILVPKENFFLLNGRPYQGMLRVMIDPKNQTPMLINILPLEEYVSVVSASEIFPAWPKEMHKVQAIASRSYAMHQILTARKQGQPYDIKNNAFHQMYKGQAIKKLNHYKHIRAAVDETQNLILTHKNFPIIAMFDSCCGGTIPAKMQSKMLAPAPYLKRRSQCIFCKKSSSFKWRSDLSGEKILKYLSQNEGLAKKIHNLGTIAGIKLNKIDNAGVVRSLFVEGTNKTIKISGGELASACKFKSSHFKVREGHKKFIFEGSGLGHLIGLCQYGARELVKRGWNCKKILSFYYPYTKFATIKKIEQEL